MNKVTSNPAERIKPARGQCWILKRVPVIKNSPVRKTETNRKSLLLL
jgi:hypothetical protein